MSKNEKYKNNKNEFRDKFKELIKNKINDLDDIEINDLEIGIFNASLDYAIKKKIQLSWSNTQFQNIYNNISRSIYSNLLSTSYPSAFIAFVNLAA